MKKYFVILLLSACFQARAQNVYRGIVADSITLNNMSGVYVNVKGTHRVSISTRDGTFVIAAKPSDTLVFRMMGYKSLLLPLLLQEDALFVLLSEDQIVLQGVVIRGWRLYPNKVEDQTIEKPTTRSILTNTGGLSLFDYFWKLERERRKLKKIAEEENKSQTYRQVITDPAVKDIMMKDHHIDETTYYHLLAKFNVERRMVQYFTDPDAIMISLHEFIDRSVKNEK